MITESKQVIILIMLLAIMFLACGGEPAITGARSAAETCAISLVAIDADVESLDFIAEGLGGYWTATGKYNNGLNVFSVSFTLEPCLQRSN